jgi:hypothetical protein
MEVILWKQKGHTKGTMTENQYTQEIEEVVGQRRKHYGIGKYCRDQAYTLPLKRRDCKAL